MKKVCKTKVYRVLSIILFFIPNIITFGTPFWDWPLKPPPLVVTSFNKPEKKWEPGHRGVDLLGHPNETVYAAGNGKIVFSGKIAGIGIISIQHEHNLRTTYQPIKSDLKTGNYVSKGEKIGVLLAGHPSCLPRTCLHWGLLKGSAKEANYLNPLILIYGIHVILKPI